MSLDKHATEIERKIAHKIVDDALTAGFSISVYDGEETTVKQARDRAVILDAMATTGSDRLVMYREGRHCGWVLLIWGNGADLLSDHAANDTMEALLQPVYDYAETLGG